MIQLKKKNIGYILLGAAGEELVGAFITSLVILPIYERQGIPTYQIKVIFIIALIFSIISISILILIGLIFIIKFHNE